MKFASETRPSKCIVPFGNIEPTSMPLSGHFMDIEGRVLVHLTQSNLLPHGDKGRFLVLIFTPHLSGTKSV